MGMKLFSIILFGYDIINNYMGYETILLENVSHEVCNQLPGKN